MSRKGFPLGFVLFLSLQSALASAIPASQLFDKRATCASRKLDTCSSKLPSNFCCPSGTTCMALAGDTTALCCPDGQSCEFIQPIICDVSAQNPDKTPSPPIITNVLDVDMEKCGSDKCCPFGYTCAGGGTKCQKKPDQSQKPGKKNNSSTSSQSSAATSTTEAPKSASQVVTLSQPTTEATSVSTSATAAATTATEASSTATSTSTPDQQSEPKSSGGGASTTSIVGGVVAACLILLIIFIVIFIYIRRSNARRAESERRQKPPMRHHNPTGSFSGQVISGPISQPGSYRTDFIRKNSPHSSLAMDAEGATTRGEEPRQERRKTQTNLLPVMSIEPRQEKRKTRTTLFPRISIPNPFSSPNPSHGSRSPESVASSHADDDAPPRHGAVSSSRLAPIRAMKASSKYGHRSQHGSQMIHKDPSSENIDIFADPDDLEDDGCSSSGGSTRSKGSNIARKPVPFPVKPTPTAALAARGYPGADRLTKGTTFTDLMDQAELGDVHRGERQYVPYVPGATPRI